MKQKKSGFTLIELLAVIVILAIIALIAVPVILNIIDKANKSAFKDTAYGILSAGELYWAEQQLEVNGMTQEMVTFQLPDTTNTLGLKGDIPTGSITITRDGDIAIAVYNDRYCVTKGYNDDDITLTEEFDNCDIVLVRNEGITLSTTSVSVINGGTYQIVASVNPSTSTNQALSYTSNDETIATVSETGLITGVSAGTTTITVSTTDGSNLSQTLEVIVRQQVTSVTLDKTSVEIDAGSTETVTATILPENAYIKTLKWESQNTSVATVENGVITGVTGGTTTVTATTMDGSNIVKTVNVTVKQVTTGKTLADLITGTPTNNCVTSGKCTPAQIATNEGIKVTINVKAGTPKDFYVLADDGEKVTLIMSENLGDNVKWYDSTTEDNSHGPTKALEQLASLTYDWQIPEFTYALSGKGHVGETQRYPNSQVTAKARLITYAEATAVGCTISGGSCPDWIYVNLYTTGNNNTYGYWTSTASASWSSDAWLVLFDGTLSSDTTNSSYWKGPSCYGVRPVIELSKSL